MSPSHETMLVVVGRGASDPDANSNVAKVMRMLWEGFGFGWGETAYSGVTFPLVEPALEHAAKLGYRRIVVFPYFLFTGVLVQRIYDYTDAVAARHPEIEFVKAPYLNDHPMVLETFMERIDEIHDRREQHELPALQVPRTGAGLRGRGRAAAGKPPPPRRRHRHRRRAWCSTIMITIMHDHGHGHDHGHSHDDHGDHHHPYPHADHPLGPKTMKKPGARPPWRWTICAIPMKSTAVPSRSCAEEADLFGRSRGHRDVAIRLVHACGMPDIVADLRWSDGAVAGAREALASGAPVICDARWSPTASSPLVCPADNQVLCMIDVAQRRGDGERAGHDAPAAQVELWKPFLPGSVVAIGNAPTALFRLLEIIAEDLSRMPAAILGFPVGFVGAAESKDALHEAGHDVPYITLLGRRGGSAMASAAVNALAGRSAMTERWLSVVGIGEDGLDGLTPRAHAGRRRRRPGRRRQALCHAARRRTRKADLAATADRSDAADRRPAGNARSACWRPAIRCSSASASPWRSTSPPTRWRSCRHLGVFVGRRAPRLGAGRRRTADPARPPRSTLRSRLFSPVRVC